MKDTLPADDRIIRYGHLMKNKAYRGISVKLLAEDMNTLLENGINISALIRKAVSREAKKYR